MVFTPPGDFAFTTAYVPFLAPPFDDSDGLQSNARFHSYATATKPRTPQVGLGLLFGDSDFLSHLDGPMSPAVDPLLDSPQLTATATNASPAQLFRLDRFIAPETSSCTTDTAAGAALDASSSAFSIRDWIIQPSSSPVPSRSLTPSPQPCLGGRTDADVNLLVPASTLPGVPASINSSVLATSVDGSHASGFLHRLHLNRLPPTGGCPSPSRTSIPGGPCAPEISNVQSLDVTHSKFDFRKRTGEPFYTPMGASRRFTGDNHLALGSALMSPRDPLSSNNDIIGPIVSPDTPMSNMHQGISECDLQRRVNRFRRRHPGKSLDRHWLSKYAGKLSKDGKAIEEYRCYISGCAQINKRRDHIIVHICSHVNERPFACRHCQMTFLRRNECKRHEAGHSGLKPFVCLLCPSPAARFSRQDLLTRHARRAHDMAAPSREKRQLPPEVDRDAQSGGDVPIRKRARMSNFRLCSSREMYLE